MSTATAALDPGKVIAAAMRELYDQLREIVDRGPTDDPGLLDEIGKLTGRIRGRITRVRKRAAAVAEQASEKPATPVTPATTPSTAPAPVKPSVAPTITPSDQKPRPSIPAATPTNTPRVTVPLNPRPAVPKIAETPGHPARLPLWVHALVIMLMVAGVALAATVTPWGLGGILAGAVVSGAARRWNVRRQATIEAAAR